MKPVVALRQFVFVSLVLLLTLSICLPMTLSAQSADPTATVVSAGLNVRSGPGVGYARIGAVTRNTVLPVIGQAQNCGWLKVTLADGAEGWVSGGARYTRLNVPCNTVPVATAGSAAPAAGGSGAAQPAATTPAATTPAATTPAATTPAATTPAATTPAQSAPAPATPTPAPATPTPAPTAPPAAEALPPGFGSDPLPPDQACYLVQNFVGPELTVTFTNQDSGQSMDFRVPSGGEVLKCITPGRYTVTADAPPPWGSLNFSFTAFPGEREYMPFSARP
jgi:uncharacterized protein YraI